VNARIVVRRPWAAKGRVGAWPGTAAGWLLAARMTHRPALGARDGGACGAKGPSLWLIKPYWIAARQRPGLRVCEKLGQEAQVRWAPAVARPAPPRPPGGLVLGEERRRDARRVAWLRRPGGDAETGTLLASPWTTSSPCWAGCGPRRRRSGELPPEKATRDVRRAARMTHATCGAADPRSPVRLAEQGLGAPPGLPGPRL
jgi:hypothetical protein